MAKPMRIVVGMQIRLRKTHPCGGDLWQVTRTGTDVGAICLRCQRRVLMEREEFERNVREIVLLPKPPQEENTT